MAEEDGKRRFWVFYQELPQGPYLPEDLPLAPGFSPDAAVCPENLLGEPEERWQRAADTEALLFLFPPSARGNPDAAAAVAVARPKLPKAPDAPLGGLEERLSRIDDSLSETKRRILRRQEQFSRLDNDLEKRISAAQELETRIREMALTITGEQGPLREELKRAHAAMRMQEIKLEKLSQELEIAESETQTEAKKLSEEALQEKEARLNELERRLENYEREAREEAEQAAREEALNQLQAQKKDIVGQKNQLNRQRQQIDALQQQVSELEKKATLAAASKPANRRLAGSFRIILPRAFPTP